jgi:predicted nucleic acid-binding protein
MIIVSNTSPIMNLLVIGKSNLLNELYGNIFIPQGVFQELSNMHYQNKIKNLSWLKIETVSDSSLLKSLFFELDKGEAESITLAVEKKSDILLIDERKGRRVADHFQLKFIGLLGILIEAKSKGIIPKVKPILDDLIAKAGFWIDNKLYDYVLEVVEE